MRSMLRIHEGATSWRNSVQLCGNLKWVSDQILRQHPHSSSIISFNAGAWVPREQFYEWCDERGVVREPETDANGMRTGLLNLTFQNDDDRFECKMRWL